MTANTSKYAHQSATITPMPRIAAVTSPGVIDSCAAPTPSEITDSPRAMMTISPYRSAKCVGEMCHARPRVNKGPEYKTMRAITQSGARHRSSTNAAPRMINDPTSDAGANRSSASSRSWSRKPATV